MFYSYRRPTGQISLGGSPTPAVKYLIIANFVIYFLELLPVNFLKVLFRHLALTPELFWSGEIWQIGTYMFLHDPGSPSHILFNMLVLWLFGNVFEIRWGSKGFLKFYFLSGLIAGAFILLANFIFPTPTPVPTLGASGALYGLIAAFGVLFPENYIYFYAIFPIKGKHFALLFVGITLLYALSDVMVHGGMSGVSYSAHLGGLIAGYILVKGIWRPRRFKLWLQELKLKYLSWKHKIRVLPSNKEDDDRQGPPPGGWYH